MVPTPAASGLLASASGPGTPAGSPLGPQVEAARARWVASGDFSGQTLARACEIADRFAHRLAAQGVSTFADVDAAHCQGFVDAPTTSGAPPELTTRHARRTALRMLFRSLREAGICAVDPTVDLRLPARSVTAARPLSDVEVTLCRASARLGEAGAVSLQRATAWALAETTAMTSEISRIRLSDVDDPHAPRWVQLPGTRRLDPRLGQLTDWGAAIVARQLRVLAGNQAGPHTLLTYRGRGVPGQDKAQSATCNAIGAILDLAGLSSEPDIRPASVRNWAGRRLYDGGMPIEQVARRMGCWSLDTAATAIALTWRPS
jgi:integrase/recombinase XerC